MKNKIIKTVLSLFLISCLCFKNILFAQSQSPQFAIRTLAQLDFQKALFTDTNFPFEFKEHKNSTVNVGLDFLIEFILTKDWSIYGGIGYFRNKFQFKRAYDHRLLNIGTDSIAIGTSTHNYIYSLLRFPIGIKYQLSKGNTKSLSLGLENVINFSFKQTYNGTKPFPKANNKYSNFQYYGNGIILFIQGSKRLNENSSLELAPYIRVSNIYKRKDPFLFENGKNFYSRFFDAIGFSIKYSFNNKKNSS